MSNTLFNNHPLIDNSNQYFFEKKYLTINSEDRDFSKYPNSSEFEILLPQEYLNVASVRLYSWSFPSNYNVFSTLQSNVSMTFKFDTLYNPGAVDINDPLLEGIFVALYNNIEQEYIIEIEPGFYNPDQMSIELTNKFNEVVTTYIDKFFSENETTYSVAKNLFQQYNRFNIVYNTVSQKLWFGNTTDKFILTNDSAIFFKRDYIDSSCKKKNYLPDYSSWGLPSSLGFSRCSSTSINANDVSFDNTNLADPSVSYKLGIPRFYYGEAVVGSGDDGYWLLPGAPKATVYWTSIYVYGSRWYELY